MIEFIITTLLLLVMLIEKIFFINLESVINVGYLGVFNLVIIVIIVVLGILSFMRVFFRVKTNAVNIKNIFFEDYQTILLWSGIILVLLFCGYLNFIKIFPNWDAIALYDARAKFLLSGIKFSDMLNLSVYDSINKYYYLLYPPFTSIAHYFWHNIDFIKNINIGIYYFALFLLFTSFIYATTKNYLSNKASLLMVLLIISNISIFGISIIEYTNLPFVLYVISGVFLLYSYLQKPQLWKILYGILLISLSMWIRQLELVWVVVTISFVIVNILSKKYLHAIYSGALMLLVCGVEYISWNYFIKVAGHSPAIFTTSLLDLANPLVGVFTGVWLNILVVIIKSWGLPIILVILVLVQFIINWKNIIKNSADAFIFLTILLSFILYFSEIYFLSFQIDSWIIFTNSLDRSTSYLIPLCAFIFFKQIKNK